MEGDLKDQANQLFDAGDYKRSVRLFSQLANVVPNADERAAALIGRRRQAEHATSSTKTGSKAPSRK
jgi:cytochrome c-type biogenesis protein CcmH/NrfG